MRELYDNLTWYLDDCVRSVRRLLTQLRTALYYFKVGFKDKDWDYYHLQNLMKIKLTRMKACFEDYEISEQDPETARQITKALKHLDLWMNMPDWQVERYTKLKLKYGIVHKSIPIEIGGNKYFKRVTESTNGQSLAEFNEEVDELYRQSEKWALDNKNEFFHIVRNNIETWWN